MVSSLYDSTYSFQTLPWYKSKTRQIQITPQISKFGFFPNQWCAGTKPSEGAGQRQRAAAPTNQATTQGTDDTPVRSTAELPWSCPGSIKCISTWDVFSWMMGLLGSNPVKEYVYTYF